MKILVVHNFYRLPGGEDRVFEDECRLLEDHGHDVVRFTKHNDDLSTDRPLTMLRNTIRNRSVEQELIDVIRRERPQIMHCHNTFPLISPAAWFAARREGVKVIQTLHNYRLLCPAATLLRDGQVCEKCVGLRIKLPAVRHACYRDSRSATAATTAMLAVHRQQGTWTNGVDRYIALTEFSRRKFIEGGLPAERIRVKPNLIQSDPGIGTHDGDYAVFVGRLSVEKGIETLLNAWEQLSEDICLKIAGDGPLADRVSQATRDDSRIEWLGQVAGEEVAELTGRARVLIMPSICYETFGRTIAEAFATGTPVIASRMGAMQELVDDGHTGVLFTPGDSRALANRLKRLWHQPNLRGQMQRNARAVCEDRFMADANYEQLRSIYEEALIADSRLSATPATAGV